MKKQKEGPKDMKKKTCLLLSLTLLLLIFCGCSSLLDREKPPTEIYKDFIQLDEAENESIVSENAGAVVTIVSTFYPKTSNGYQSAYINIYSGIVINSQGYILTHYSAAYAYDCEVNSSYAVLSSVYNDSANYRIQPVSYDKDAGLALFKFYDAFYHYTDETEASIADGLQFTAKLSAISVETGEVCTAIGNSLGNLTVTGSRLTSAEQTVTRGIVSNATADETVFSIEYNQKTYRYFQISAAVNPEMIGGGVFDRNGYLIGCIASKIISSDDTSGNYEYIYKSAIVYDVSLMIDFVNTVSEELQAVIPLTIASSGNSDIEEGGASA